VKIKAWPVLAELSQALEAKDARALNPAVFDAIVDRLEAALAAGDNHALETLTHHLEAAARQWAAAGSDDARKALRGDRDATAESANLLVAGRLGFAQNLAARALDKRADDAFYELIADRRYQPYICALMAGPRSGIELALAVDEVEETVSRKLRILEEGGVVRRRKNGQVTMNLLTPAARQYAEAKRIGPAGGQTIQPAVKSALAERSDKIEDHLQSSRMLGVRHEPERVDG